MVSVVLRSPNFDFEQAHDEMKSKFYAHDVAVPMGKFVK